MGLQWRDKCRTGRVRGAGGPTAPGVRRLEAGAGFRGRNGEETGRSMEARNPAGEFLSNRQDRANMDPGGTGR